MIDRVCACRSAFVIEWVSCFGVQDGTVAIWKQVESGGAWAVDKLPKFPAAVWRVSWGITGNILAVRVMLVHGSLFLLSVVVVRMVCDVFGRLSCWRSGLVRQRHGNIVEGVSGPEVGDGVQGVGPSHSIDSTQLLLCCSTALSCPFATVVVYDRAWLVVVILLMT